MYFIFVWAMSALYFVLTQTLMYLSRETLVLCKTYVCLRYSVVSARIIASTSPNFPVLEPELIIMLVCITNLPLLIGTFRIFLVLSEANYMTLFFFYGAAAQRAPGQPHS